MSLIIDDLQIENTLTGTGFATSVQSEITAQKGAVNGLCELDGAGIIPSNRLPAFVDDALEFANLAAFPVAGLAGKIYVALDTNKTYRWSGSLYIEISSSPVDSIFGRIGNVVAQAGDYTPAQVGADPSGSAASAQSFSIQRSNHTGTQNAVTISDFETSVLNTDLLGVVTTATEIKVVAADSILQSIGKLQGQLSLRSEKVQNTQLTNASNVTLTNISDLAFNVVLNKKYKINCMLLYRSGQATTGMALTVALGGGAAGTLSLIASIPSGGDGTDAVHQGMITASADLVIAPSTPVVNTDYVAIIDGIFVCTASGTVTPQFRSENNGQTITVQIGSNISVREF